MLNLIWNVCIWVRLLAKELTENDRKSLAISPTPEARCWNLLFPAFSSSRRCPFFAEILFFKRIYQHACILKDSSCGKSFILCWWREKFHLRKHSKSFLFCTKDLIINREVIEWRFYSNGSVRFITKVKSIQWTNHLIKTLFTWENLIFSIIFFQLILFALKREIFGEIFSLNKEMIWASTAKLYEVRLSF